MSTRPQHLYEFGPYRLDTAEQMLLRDGKAVPLTPKAFETLVALVERSGHLVEKEELMRVVWADAYVEESNLTNNVSALRKLLGRGKSGRNYIETVPKRGYRFTVPVKELPHEALVVEKRTLTRVATEQQSVEDNSLIGAGETIGHASHHGQALKTTHDISLAKRRAWPWLLIALLSVPLSVAGFFIYRSLTPTPSQIESIAVLPFKNESGNPDVEYLSDGVTETLINSLSQLSNLSVKARSTVFRYKDRTVEPQTVAAELSVQAIVNGRVVQRGDDLTLYLSLVDGRNGNQLWGHRYDRKLTDLVALQNEIGYDVSQKLRARLSDPDEQKLAKSYTKNAEAYKLYLKGRYYWYKSTPEDSSKAREYFQQAIDVDPSFALAYSGLADVYGRASARGEMRPEEGWPRHEAAVRKALELDPNIAEIHNSLAGLRLYYYRDVPGAESEFKRAIELDPNYVEARAHYGGYLILMGRFDEAIAQSTRAQELDPLSPGIRRRFGLTLFHARRYDEAIQQFLKALEMNPGYVLAHEDLGDAYEQKKMYGEAVAAWHRAMTLSRNDELAAILKRTYKESGYEGAVRAASRKSLEQLREKARRGEFVPAMDFVRLHVRLGDKQQAFAWLEKAYQERTRLIFAIKVDPLFDDLRADPRFIDLLRRLNLNGGSNAATRA
jgi:TolB-like protein/DNA-binding winged helix-turn-helix (wHTH) protein/Tfp pilus assembly protein PilF